MAQDYRHVVFLSIKEGNMLTQTKIFVWGAYNFKKCQKNGVPECCGRLFEVL